MRAISIGKRRAIILLYMYVEIKKCGQNIIIVQS